MHRLGSLALSLLVVCSFGCATSEDSGAGSPVSDSSVSADGAADVMRSDTPGTDTTSPDTTSPDTAGSDTASSDTRVADGTASDAVSDTAKSDAMLDVTPSDTGGKARGQCFNNAHCNGGTCQPDAPGGICNGCGIDPGICPVSFDTCGNFGACTRACTEPSVCMSGTTCLTASGVCALISCSGPSDCPATHACRSVSAGGATFCRRVLCPLGTECPSGTTCRDTGLTPAKVCVEDALFFGP